MSNSRISSINQAELDLLVLWELLSYSHVGTEEHGAMVLESQPGPCSGHPLTALEPPLLGFSYPVTGKTCLTCQHFADKAVKDRKPDPDTLYVVWFF